MRRNRESGFTGNFRQRRRVGHYDRRTALHGFQHSQPEPLVQGKMDERVRHIVKNYQVLRGHFPEIKDIFPDHPLFKMILFLIPSAAYNKLMRHTPFFDHTKYLEKRFQVFMGFYASHIQDDAVGQPVPASHVGLCRLIVDLAEYPAGRFLYDLDLGVVIIPEHAEKVLAGMIRYRDHFFRLLHRGVYHETCVLLTHGDRNGLGEKQIYEVMYGHYHSFFEEERDIKMRHMQKVHVDRTVNS